MRIRLETIGCRLNTGEIDALARHLSADGHRIVASGEAADLCIFNSCAVTGTAVRKSRHAIRALRRSLPGARIVVTGCLAELSPEAVRELGADLVVGNRDKERLPEVLDAAGLLDSPVPATTTGNTARPGEVAWLSRTRAFLKVQDGCDNRCTYCVVTFARGPGRSVAADEVVAQVRQLRSLGFLEVVLTGVHLGSYGHDRGETEGLYLLVQRILAETDIPRLRLSSLEPWDIGPSLFDLFADCRLLPHLHLPLQSGCDATLRRMGRHTSRDEVAALISEARRRIADVAISTDIMVGFPGESDQEFAESEAFVARMAFSRLHIFRYSRREGTAAAGFSGTVSGPVAQQRSARMHRLGARLAEEFCRSFLGRSLAVLWETSEPTNGGRRWSGLSPNYLRITTDTGPDVDLGNRITDTTLLEVLPGGGGLLGSTAL